MADTQDSVGAPPHAPKIQTDTTTKRPTLRAVIKAEQEADAAESRATLAERQRIAHDRTLAATARLTAAAAGLDPERMIHVQHQDAVDGAIEDAFFGKRKERPTCSVRPA